MNLAVPVWRGRVAPLFDVCRQLLLMEVAEERVRSRREVDVSEAEPWKRVPRLAGLGVDTLICGAISLPLQQQAQDAGIQVIPFMAGEVDRVVDAWLKGRLDDGDFRMPGCGMRRRRRRGPGRGRRA